MNTLAVRIQLLRAPGGSAGVSTDDIGTTLVIAFALTMAAFVTQIAVSLKAEPTHQAKSLLSTCDTITKMGTGAIFGLLSAEAG